MIQLRTLRRPGACDRQRQRNWHACVRRLAGAELGSRVSQGPHHIHYDWIRATKQDAERLEREQAPFRPFPPLWVRFLRVVGAALLVVLIQADWTQRKLRDYFLRPLARLTNRVSPRGYQTYDWDE